MRAADPDAAAARQHRRLSPGLDHRRADRRRADRGGDRAPLRPAIGARGRPADDQAVAPAGRAGRRVMDGRRVVVSLAAEPRPGHVRRRHDLVPHALRRPVRAGGRDPRPPPDRPAAARCLVLPAELGAGQRRGHRGDAKRLALAAAQHVLAGGRAARLLVRRPPLPRRPRDPRRRRDRLRRRDLHRDAGGGGAQRRHGARVPRGIRRLPDQRPPAAGANRRGRSPTSPSRARHCSTAGR